MLVLRRARVATAAGAAITNAASRATRVARPRRAFSGSGAGGRRKEQPSAGFGVVFDIDGVLVRGGQQIPGAMDVLEHLGRTQTHPDTAKRIPYIFMTNGGGCLEREKAHEISSAFFPGLSVPVRPSQVQLSHTPMRALVPEYKNKQILALGCKDYVHVAKSYGFQHVVTPQDVLHAHPELYPFKTYHKRHDLHTDPFAAIFILHDPVEWAEEIQVLCDLVEGGVLATHPQHAGRKQHIPVYSSNSDLVFSSTYSVPRLAQGSFIEAWKHVYKTCYDGPDIEITRYGKPFPLAYRFAERLLVHDARAIGALPPDPAPHQEHQQHDFPLKRIYAIGDNPASDIAGANAADRHCCEWVSILVRTGVFQDDPGHHPAKHVVDDVKSALHLIAELEGRSL